MHRTTHARESCSWIVKSTYREPRIQPQVCPQSVASGRTRACEAAGPSNPVSPPYTCTVCRLIRGLQAVVKENNNNKPQTRAPNRAGMGRDNLH